MKRVALSKLASGNVQQLPRLAVPPLNVTGSRYLESVRAIKPADAIAAHEAKLSAFLSGAGSALQRELEKREMASPAGYVQRALLEAQLQARTPVEVYRNPGFVLKRSSLADITDGSQTGVAAALIHGVGTWIRDAVRDGVRVPCDDATPLDLSPLASEFGRSLMPAKDTDSVATLPLDRLRHVMVLHDGHANLVRVLDESGQRVEDRSVIQRALEVILSTTPNQDNPAPVSVLTASSRALWGQAHAELVKTPENAEALKLFQEAMLVVCLDSNTWGSDGSGDVVGPAVLHGRQEEVENRWYDKHQLIVSADGQAAFNFEASMSWMPHWAHWIDEVLGVAASAGPASASSSVVPAEVVAKVLQPVVVTYGKLFATHIRTARQEAAALATSTEGRGVKLPLGSAELSRVGMSGDAFVQCALHLAHHRRRGCLCPTASVVSQTSFYGGHTDAARSSTVEVQLMCEAFKEHVKPGEAAVSSTKREELAALVHAAAAKHAALVRAAAAGEGVDRHLQALHQLAKERGDDEALAFFADPFYQSTHRFLVNACEFSRSWLSLVALGPMDSRGCGVGFTVDTSETRLHVSTAADSPLCSCEEHSQSIVTAAMDLYRILGGTS